MRARCRAVLLLLVLVWLPGCAGVFFQPMKEHVLEPADHGIQYEDIWFASMDGVDLHGWFLPATTAQAEGTVLFLHGNAENISTHVAAVAWLPERGFNVFLFDYRGYGRSEGRPDLAGVHRDAEAALRRLSTLPGVDTDRVIVFGQSLGGAVAITLVAEAGHVYGVQGVAADSPISSYRGIVREKLGDFWLTWPLQWPLSWTVTTDFDPVRHVASVSPIPLLVLVGERDTIVPPHHGQRLYRAAEPPAEIRQATGAGHIQSLGVTGERDYLVDWMRHRLNAGNQPHSSGAAQRKTLQ